MTFTTNVRGDFKTVSQTHTANFTQCGVRFFRSGCIYAGTYTTFLRACFQRRNVLLATFMLRGLRTSWLIVAIIKKAPGFLLRKHVINPPRLHYWQRTRTQNFMADYLRCQEIYSITRITMPVAADVLGSNPRSEYS